MGTLSFFIGLLAIFLPICSAASQDMFNLFAYGDNIGGLPLVFRDGIHTYPLSIPIWTLLIVY